MVISWDKVLPGSTRPAARLFSALATATGTVHLTATLYAAELAEPITSEFRFQVRAENEEWSLDRLREVSSKVGN